MNSTFGRGTERLRGTGSEVAGGPAPNHGPMAAEALAALGCDDVVVRLGGPIPTAARRDTSVPRGRYGRKLDTGAGCHRPVRRLGGLFPPRPAR